MTNHDEAWNDDARNVDGRDDSRRANDPNAENRDDHPVGTTSGTGAGATAGAVGGMAIGGPAGAVVGGVVGGIVGGAAGHGIADVLNPEGDQVSGDRIRDPGTDER
jgi:outer membrane lipoprotein SlyB